MRCIEQEA